MELIVEQLGTSHNVIDRRRYDKERISVGRGYGNDLILTDEHVDPVHARIDFVDGQWWIHDLDSVNGLRKRGTRQRRESWAIRSGDIFIIGRAKIRILLPDHPVPPATRIRRSEQFLLWLGNWPVLLGLVLVYAGLAAGRFYANSTTELDWQALVVSEVQTALGYLLLVVAVYFLSVLFKRSGHFLSHLGVLVFLAVLVVLLRAGLKLLHFNGASELDSLATLADEFIGVGAYLAYLWCILYLAFHLSLKWRTGISVLLVSAFAVIALMQDSQLREHRPFHRFEADWSMLPPSLLLRAPVSQEAYFEDAYGSFDTVDERRDEAQRQAVARE